MNKFSINKYDKSQEMFKRALKVIPSGVYGHLGPAEGCFTPVDAFPLFSSKAEGAYFYDLDGNRFIDYMCAYGPNILGYNDKDVNDAAIAQANIANCTTSPSYKLVEFAELLTDTVTSADWAFFCKNGGDTTTLSVMAARAYKNRKKIIFFNYYYHGVAPWTQKADYPGILEEDVSNNLYVDFNNIEQLKKVISENKGQIAGLIATPYMHGNFIDNVLPDMGFWQSVRALCTENDIILIIDDVRCGFRLDLKGSDHYYGFEADMICFCKALANGWNVSALCGKDFLKPVLSAVTYTGSYWMSAVPFAAGIACIEKLKKLNAPQYLREKALMLTNGIADSAKSNGFNMIVSGEPQLFYLRIANDNSLMLNQEWVAECVKRGVFLTSHHNHFTCMAMTDEDIKFSIDVADEAFKIVRARHPELK